MGWTKPAVGESLSTVKVRLEDGTPNAPCTLPALSTAWTVTVYDWPLTIAWLSVALAYDHGLTPVAAKKCGQPRLKEEPASFQQTWLKLSRIWMLTWLMSDFRFAPKTPGGSDEVPVSGFSAE